MHTRKYGPNGLGVTGTIHSELESKELKTLLKGKRSIWLTTELGGLAGVTVTVKVTAAAIMAMFEDTIVRSPEAHLCVLVLDHNPDVATIY